MRNLDFKNLDKELRVSINNDVLGAIFAECDKYDRDETGGRMIGFIQVSDDILSIEVCGLIESGTDAKRTSTSLFQDGKHQERIFRHIEEVNPAIEHLGNWHTHHVNGLRTLSGGDIETYTRTVNHPNYNIDFFYALLVVSKRGTTYDIRHFLFKRNDPSFYEIPNSSISILNRQSIYLPGSSLPPISAPSSIDHTDKVKKIRISDNYYVPRLFPKFKPYFSKFKSLYWRGRLDLIDNSNVEVLVLESIQENDDVYYSAAVAKSEIQRFPLSNKIKEVKFGSAIEALTSVERTCNHVIYSSSNNLKE